MADAPRAPTMWDDLTRTVRAAVHLGPPIPFQAAPGDLDIGAEVDRAEFIQGERSSLALNEPAGIKLTKAVPLDRNPVRVYLASRTSRKTRLTMIDSLKRIARVLDPLGQTPIDAIPWETFDFAHTSAIRAQLLARFGPATVQLALCAMRGVLRTAWRLKLMDSEQFNRAVDWDKIRFSRLPAGRDIPPDEIAKIQAYARSEAEPYSAFLCGIFATLFGGGLRAQELCSLPVDSYRNGELRFFRKGNKEVIVCLGSEAEDVEAWLAARKDLEVPTQWLFVRVLRSFVRGSPLTVSMLEGICIDVAARAGIDRFSPHDCRRTYCTKLLSSGIDLAIVQRLMAHSSPETTTRYDRRQQSSDAEARRKVEIWPSANLGRRSSSPTDSSR